MVFSRKKNKPTEDQDNENSNQDDCDQQEQNINRYSQISSTSSETKSILQSPSSPPTLSSILRVPTSSGERSSPVLRRKSAISPNDTAVYRQELDEKLRKVESNNQMEAISSEMQVRYDHQQSRPPIQKSVTFELPDLSSRRLSTASSHSQGSNKSASSSVSRRLSGIFSSITNLVNPNSDTRRSSLSASNDVNNANNRDSKPIIMVGTRVRLFRRPVATFGIVKFRGPIPSRPGIWLGIELDEGVGDSDGAFEGARYFQTNPNRSAFLKMEDVQIA